jgi:hypothetical protein
MNTIYLGNQSVIVLIPCIIFLKRMLHLSFLSLSLFEHLIFHPVHSLFDQFCVDTFTFSLNNQGHYCLCLEEEDFSETGFPGLVTLFRPLSQCFRTGSC